MKLRLLTLALLALLGVPTSGAASSSNICDTFGCSDVGPVTPWSGLPNWNPNLLPPAGCRWVSDSSRGIYPVALKPAIAFPLPLKWITSYVFHVRVTWCWTADSWVQNQYGDVDFNSVTNPHITKFRVQVSWSDLSDVTSSEHVLQTKAAYHTCPLGGKPAVARGCLSITVTAEAQVSVPPPLKLGVVTPHPWVSFTNLGADGTYAGTDHDRKPF